MRIVFTPSNRREVLIVVGECVALVVALVVVVELLIPVLRHQTAQMLERKQNIEQERCSLAEDVCEEQTAPAPSELVNASSHQK